MKIAIVSDSHDNFKTLEKAITIANGQGCEKLLHAGDLSTTPMVHVLAKFKGDVHLVWGNHEGDKLGIVNQAKAERYDNIKFEKRDLEDEIGGVRIFMNHYEKYVRLAARTGDYDLCIYGHDHKFNEEKVGVTLLLNPGELLGWKGTSTFAIFDTNSRSVEKVELDG